jgi:glyoxylase-like metal-dependent hydrolase (beta-lactamase superfamily II)
MDAQTIARGLRRWTAFHEEWKQDVGCLALESADGLILIDPLDPPSEFRRPSHVLATVYWHGRSTRELDPPRLWAPSRSALPLRRRGMNVTDEVRPGDELPGGIEAFASGRAAELLYWLPEQQALVAGDVLLGGPLRICPPGWVGKGGQEAVREALRPLADLPVERVLVSHGEPVLADGLTHLQALL